MPRVPSILSRTPRADPKIMYRVVAGGAFDASLGYWAPRIGSLYPGTDRRIEWLFEHGAADAFLVVDGLAAGRTSSDDEARQQAAAMERRFAAESFETTDPTVRTGAEAPPEHQVVCIQQLHAGGGGGTTVFEAGLVYNAALPLVKSHPDHFRPALADDLAKE